MPGMSPLLGLGLATADTPATITKSRANAKASANAEEDRQANRTQVRQQQKLMDFKLAEAGRADTLATQTGDARTQALEAELSLATQTADITKKKQLRDETFRGFDNYFKSGDPRTLNQFFKDYNQDPTVQTMFRGVVKMDKVDPANPEDKRLLREIGMSDEELDAADGKKDGKIDWAVLNKRFVKSTRNDGATKITDMLQVAAATGYGKYAEDATLARMEKLADINKKNKPSATSRDPNDTLTALQKNSNAIAEAKAAEAAGTATAQQKELIRRGKADIGGKVTGKELLANDARDALTAMGAGDMTQEQMQRNPEVRRHVNSIRSSQDLSAAQEKQITEFNSMIALSKEAGALSGDQAGLWDKTTSQLTSYVSSNVTTKREKAAYGAFINQFRHNLFGSALTPGEMTAFNTAYSSLGQKIGPVLAGLRAAVLQIESQMNTISDMNDPFVMKMVTGKSIADIEATRKNIDERLKFYDLVAEGKAPDEARKLVKSSRPAPSTVEDVSAALFGGS